ncbi:MAG TPA: molybdopterin-guanine dinucleotide biosynthesis protein B [Gammaproteobacteria bacterium]|nr:molybdopterin-guanine dinucleotide biosynthesis protein B [Gammaproteobacteria bacterium]
MARHDPLPVCWDDASAFANLNTPVEFEAWAERHAPPERPGPPTWVGGAPVIGIAAPSGTGKTTLLEATLPHLVAAGLRIALVKHAHHDFDLDQPGKDSHRLRQAGARQVVVGSARRVASIIEREDPEQAPSLGEFLARIDPALTDLVLVEGFKRDPIPRFALARTGAPSAPVPLDDPWLVALACDAAFAAPSRLPRLDIDDPAAVAAFLVRWRRERLLGRLLPDTP